MKKRNLSLIVVFSILFGVYFSSCDKDDFTEEDALLLNNQLSSDKDEWERENDKEDARVNYTLILVDAATTTLKSTEGLSGALVTLASGDSVMSQTTDASGVAFFPGLERGHASVTITMENYSPVNYVVNLDVSSNDNGGNRVGNVVPMIPVAGASTSTITGKVLVETDLTNASPETAPEGVKVIAKVDAGSEALDYITGFVSISYGDLNLVATTDANGQFTMTVPATAQGLSYDFIVEDFTADQSLLMNTINGLDVFGVQSIPTVFGSSVAYSPTSVPNVAPVYATISDPEGYTYTEAQATAVIEVVNGIKSVNVTNSGNNYLQGYYSGSYGETYWQLYAENEDADTEARLNVYTRDGRITKVSVSNAGDSYIAGSDIDLSYEQDPFWALVTSVNAADSSITGVSIGNSGRYLTDDVTVNIETDNGEGAEIDLLQTSYSNGRAFYGTSFNDRGHGYQVGDSIYVTVNPTTVAEATITEVTGGQVVAVEVDDPGSNYGSSSDVTVRFVDGNGTNAYATANVIDGKISYITVTNGGYGYTSAPTVEIINEVDPTAETPELRVNTNSAGEITSIQWNDSPGSWPSNVFYSVVPTVTVTPQIEGMGSGVSTQVLLNSNGTIQNILVLDGGSGYKAENSGTKSVSVKAPSYFVGGAKSYVTIDLGTGIRSIED